MMNQLSDSTYASLLHYPEHDILEQYWKTSNIPTKKWKEEMVNYVRKAQDVKAASGLVNARNFDFPIIPSLQEWAVMHVFQPLVDLGFRKMAFVMAEDVFAEFSIEETMEVGGSDIDTRFFADYGEAFRWLSGEKS